MSQSASVFQTSLYLVVGGVLSLYLRFLYRHFGSSASDAESITRVFPLLTLITTAVITVVKSSLALSLGLVGALSIVRFRAAIKEPEELVYLFLCIALGLSLGAEQPLLAIATVIVSSVFIIGMHVFGGLDVIWRQRAVDIIESGGDWEEDYYGGVSYPLPVPKFSINRRVTGSMVLLVGTPKNSAS